MTKSHIRIALYFMMGSIACLLDSGLRSQPSNPRPIPEYAPTKGVFVEWDFNTSTWPLYADLIREIQTEAIVYAIVINQAEEDEMIQRLLQSGVPVGNIVFIHTPAERIWIRDHGPISIMDDNQLVFLDLDDLANSGVDENLPTRLAQLMGINSYSLPWILCGGNYMVDSHGRLFCTKRLYANNPGFTNQQIRSDLTNYFGINQIYTFQSQAQDYWGHIDMQMKLLNDTIMVLSSVSSSAGANYDSLEANYQTLQSMTTVYGKPYVIARLPHANNWKTYANSLIVNNKVIVPVYDHPNDSIALATYQSLLPTHQVVGVNSNSIIQWEGAVHCITMQVPDTAIINGLSHKTLRPSDFLIYPNPLKAGTSLYILEKAESKRPLHIALYDAMGRFVFDFGAFHSIPEMISLPIPGHIQSGNYILLLRQEAFSIPYQISIF